MAFFSAYFDASGRAGDPNHKVMTVAGFVSDIKKWKRFEVEWNKILRRERITIFHMTDFVSSKGEFAVGWKGETDRRRMFIDDLAACLSRNVDKSFRSTLVLSDFDKVNGDFAIEETLGKPYGLCSMMCAFALRQWAKRKGVEKNLLYYFEDGDKGKGNFDDWHTRAYGTPPRFLGKKEAVGFQPADFAGWKVRTSIQESIKADHTLEKGQQLLRSISVLKNIPKDAGVITESVLIGFCQQWKVPSRITEKVSQ